MPLNFPNSPGIGSVYTDATSGFSYEWDGTLWKSYSAASSSNIKILDDISGSFNGSTQTFTLTSGGISFVPASAQSLIITLGGVTQKPVTDYTVSATNITFTTAPDALLSFSGISLGPAVPLTYANDGNIYIRNTYTGAGTTGPFSFSEGYTVGYLDVYRNGVRLRSGSDFVGTSGTNFFLTDAAAVNDEIEAIGYKVSSLVQANSNLDNLNVTGITTTGRLQVTTNANIVGIVTASSFVGNLTGNVTGNLTGTASTASFATTSFGLSGTPNLNVGFTTITGVGNTALIVNGNARITGILTIGTGSITLNGNTDSIRIGTGLTITSTGSATYSGILTASSFVGNLTGTASTASFATTSFGLTGTPNLNVGVVTATSAIIGSGVTINSSGVTLGSGQVFTGNGSGLTNISAGKILQVKSNTYNSSSTTTSGSYVVTGLTTSITPSSTSSRVLITGYFDITGNLGAGVAAIVGLYRNNTLIVDPISSADRTMQVGFSYLDSPATVGITTYAIYYKASPGGGNPATFNGGGNATPVASIQLLEVGP